MHDAQLWRLASFGGESCDMWSGVGAWLEPESRLIVILRFDESTEIWGMQVRDFFSEI
jgi:hypothetical protein